MAVNEDCRHYIMQTVGGRTVGGRVVVGSGERIERCRIEANQSLPFACPDGCLFYERRGVSSAGWIQAPKGPDESEPPGSGRT